MKKLPAFLSVVAAIGLASCERELDQVKAPATAASTAAVQSKPALLASAPWHLTGLSVAAAPKGAAPAHVVNVLPHLKAPQLDNLHSFKAGGVFVLDEGPLKMDPKAAQQLTGSWKLNSTGDSLTVSQPGLTRHFAVEELTASTLRVKLTQPGENGAVYTSTFSH